MTDKPLAKVIVCTLSADDAGEPCQHCGWAGGKGHGKART